MDRRFLTWLMLTSALCFLYLSMRPAEEKPPEQAQQAPALNADPLLRENPAAAPGGDPQPEIEGDANEGDPAKAETVEKSNFIPRVVTLGSMDPDKGFNLLVTLTSQGAGVERVELVGQNKPGRMNFRALEHDGGYLGYLGLMETVGGVKVRVVPDGSAAAAATAPGAIGPIAVDDIITDINGQSTMTPKDVEAILKKVKPGSVVTVGVTRTTNSGSENLQYSVTTTQAPLDMVRMQPWKSETVPGNLSRAALLTSLGSIGDTRIPEGKDSLPALSGTLTADWQVLTPAEANWDEMPANGAQGVEFRLPLDGYLAGTNRPAKLDLIKRYRLAPASEGIDGYILDLETIIKNRNDTQVSVAFHQEGIPGLSLEGWWYSVKISPHMFAGAGNRDVIYKPILGGQHIATTRQIQDRAKKEPTKPGIILFAEGEPVEARSLAYIGTDSQYFNASLMAYPESGSLTNLRQAGTMAVANAAAMNKSQLQATNTSFWIDTEEKTIEPGQQVAQRYEIFLGPKDTHTLEAHDLELAIEYGWFPWIAKPLGWILQFFYSIVHNYGLAIVLLTVVVRGSMFPLGRKAAMNAQRMQELQPELKRINELYKDNMEKRAKAMQELYAKHNFKPLAGCLPMFIQLPIFIGLYRCLSVDTSLRQQPLIPGIEWCSNLAGPDQLLNWSSWMPEFIAGRGTGWLGPYFNILPMATVGLFLLQQKMLMPKATDDQTRMTQNMMQVMTIFMGVLFFKVPSGLCIYFITSSLWSLVERKLVKRFTPPIKLNTPADSKESTPKLESARTKASDRKPRRSGEASPEKPKSKMQELMKMLEKPGVNSATQRGPSKPPRPTGKNKKRRNN